MSERDTDSLIDAISSRTAYSPAEVRSVIDNAQINLAEHQRPRTKLQVDRLRLKGTKSGTESSDGPFDHTFDFPSGLTVLSTEKNLRGKTSVLELITWCLRGSPKSLTDAVRKWLELVELQAIVGTEAIRVRIALGTLDEPQREEEFQVFVNDRAHEGSSEALIHSSTDENVFKRFMEDFMLRRFSMEPVAHWQRHDKESEDGQAHLDGWPALFGAVYLPNGGDKVLLGDYAISGLAGRLLQMFMSIPLAVQLTKIRVAKNAASQLERGARRRETEDANAREDTRRAIDQRREETQSELESLALPEKSLSALVDEQQAAAKRLSQVQRRLREAQEAFDGARSIRIADERAANDATETALARRLFQALNPQHCPRCETPVSAERAQQESSTHRCAVCTSHLEVEQSHEIDDEGVESESHALSEDTLAASRAAEAAARQDVDEARSAVEEAEATFSAADQAVASEAESGVAIARRDLELELARLEGQLEATPAKRTGMTPPGLEVSVLAAAEDLVQHLVKENSREPLAELSHEIVTLAHDFGISGIQSADLDLAGRLKVSVDGADSFFSKQPRGGRLRLRVAVVVALLRVGARRGVGTHPGLIMIDSPGAEEVASDDVAALLRALSSLQAELPHLQVIVATAQPSVTQDVSTSVEYQAHGDDPLW